LFLKRKEKKITLLLCFFTVKYIGRIDVIIVNDDRGFHLDKTVKYLKNWAKEVEDKGIDIIDKKTLREFVVLLSNVI